MNARVEVRPETRRIDPLPDDLNSPRAKLVYLYLTVVGRGSPDQMKADLGVEVITLLSVLKSLSKHGLVERDGDTYSIV